MIKIQAMQKNKSEKPLPDVCLYLYTYIVLHKIKLFYLLFYILLFLFNVMSHSLIFRIGLSLFDYFIVFYYMCISTINLTVPLLIPISQIVFVITIMLQRIFLHGLWIHRPFLQDRFFAMALLGSTMHI